MYVAQLRLNASERRLSAQQMAALFLSGRIPEDRVEHVHVLPERGRMSVTVFLLAASQADAECAARRFCVRVLLATPELAGWSLQC
jgi:hypothetical protein